jgi:arylsulfatase A-like enzyme
MSMPGRAIVGIPEILVILLAGCGPPPRDSTLTGEGARAALEGRAAVVDLAELLPLATLWTETEGIRLDDREVEPHLAEGWGPEEGSEGSKRVRAIGESTAIELQVERPRPVRLRMSCWPEPRSPTVAPRWGVSANGQPAGEVVFDRHPGLTYAVDLPERLLRAGRNRIEFRNLLASISVGRPVAADSAPPTIACDGFRFEGLVDGRPAHLAETDPPALVLPSGSRIVYSLVVAPRAELVIDPVRRVGSSGGGILRVSARIDGAGERVVFDGDDRQRSGGVRLVVGGEAPLRMQLTLEARTTGRVRAVELHGARLESAERSLMPSPGPRAAAVRDRERPPDIVLYLIDTLRSDHLGCYGYRRPTSPRIDAFAGEAALFEQARAQASWTRPAVASIFTGRYPHSHGVHRNRDALGATVPVLAELLRRRGYHTAAVVTNGVVGAQFGFARGFDAFEFLPEDHRRSEVHRSAFDAHAAASRLLSMRPPERPLFLYVHTTDPHAPYRPGRRWLERIGADVRDYEAGNLERMTNLFLELDAKVDEATQRDIVSLYDAEIAFNDEAFGELLDTLRDGGVLDRAWVALLSDHGEEFSEHGRWQHGLSLYEEQLRVPLIVRPPGGIPGGRRIPNLVGQVDLMPTLLEVAGAPAPDGVQGRSLLSLVAGAADADFGSSGTFAELAGDTEFRWLSASVHSGFKLIRNHRYDKPRLRRELYDLERDAGETTNLATARPVLADYLRVREEASRRFSPTAAAAEASPDRELEESLRALGYLR